jgi:hypothetical protein
MSADTASRLEFTVMATSGARIAPAPPVPQQLDDHVVRDALTSPVQKLVVAIASAAFDPTSRRAAG